MFRMFRPFFGSRQWMPIAYGGAFAVLVLTIANVYAAVALSYAVGDLGVAYQSGAPVDVYTQIAQRIGGCILVFITTDVSVHFIIKPMYSQLWTEALTRWYLGKWHHNISEIEGAAQRIQESSETVAHMTSDICANLLRRFIGLLAFIPIVWEMSKHFQFILPVPGLLLWIMLIVCSIETWLSWYLGRPLPMLQKKKQRAKAFMRTALEIIQRHRIEKSGSATHEREALVRKARKWIIRWRWRTFSLIVQSLPLVIWDQVRGSFWGYGVQIVLGVFVAVLRIFPYGIMLQTINVLGEIHNSLSIFSDSWASITTIQGSMQRLHEIEKHKR